jgi:hypothetical protein
MLGSGFCCDDISKRCTKVVEMDNCVWGFFFGVVDIFRSASVVINWYRSRTSESIFGVKFLFGFKTLRNSSSRDIELAQKVLQTE